jgi:hypothetical protein
MKVDRQQSAPGHGPHYLGCWLWELAYKRFSSTGCQPDTRWFSNIDAEPFISAHHGLSALRFNDGAFQGDINVGLHDGRLQTPERVSSPDTTGPSSPNSSLATPIPGC